jgi:hypothetical protein
LINQQVDINQSRFSGLTGIYELNVDTGSAKKRRKDQSISHSLALALKARH